MKKLIFRADGNSATGLGHLYRVFGLIEMFKDKFDFVLVTRPETTREMIPKDYHFQVIPSSVDTAGEAKWMKETLQANEHWVIADGYQFDSDYQRRIKEVGFRLLYIDDFCREHMFADVVVNHAIGVKEEDYSAETYTRFALGSAYAILRPAFLEAAKTKRHSNKRGEVFVCFGGADPLNLTVTAVKALLNVKEIKKVNTVVGAAYAHEELAILARENSRLSVYNNLSENALLEVMRGCDFAIAPASNILYELFAVKMPVLSGYYVDNQKKIYEGCLQKGLIFDGGNLQPFTVSDFESKIKELLSLTGTESYMTAQAEAFDGKSKERFINLLKPLRFRKARPSDMMQVFEWSNDPLSRANSYFSEPIPLETHEKWFSARLSDPKSLIFIAEVDDKPAGMVRYSLDENNAVVGILIGEGYRGQGLAGDFLTETARLYFKENHLPVFAYIKVQNTASVKSFEKAGYKKLREEEVHGIKSVVYQLEKL